MPCASPCLVLCLVVHQRRHAVRAYRYAEGVYKGKGWSFITDHCNFTLGRYADQGTSGYGRWPRRPRCSLARK